MDMVRPPGTASTAGITSRGATGLVLVGSTTGVRSGTARNGLDALLHAPTALGAIHAAERLRRAVARTPYLAPPMSAWPDPLRSTVDPMTAFGLLHALAETRLPQADEVLLRAMEHPDAGVREHAVWALARRTPIEGSISQLVGFVAAGGYLSMLSGMTLQAWASTDPSQRHGIISRLHRAALSAADADARRRLVDLVAVITGSAIAGAAAEAPSRQVPGRGLRVVQLLLHGHLDAGLRDASAGDGGGLVTLLVTLARALGQRPEVEWVMTIARRRSGDPAGPESLGSRSCLERIEFGGDVPVSMGSAWEHWPSIERQLGSILRQAGRVDALHLRLGDVGSMAAMRVARALDIPVVFTLAPDPHGVIDAVERAGTLSRDTFAAYDLAQHAWFRARLVTSIATAADRLVMFPRRGGPQEVAGLLDIPLDTARLTVVPEGIDLAQASAARASVAMMDPFAIVADLRARIGAAPPGRAGLPLIVSAARLHPVKGLDRLVSAWLGEPRLRDGFNLVIAGGELRNGTLEERQTLDAIRAVGSAAGVVGDIPGLFLLGSVSNRDVSVLLATAASGAAPTIGQHGIYVCSSAKEEFGLSIVEALAAGLPVVAPNGGGPRTYILHGRTGVLTDTTSVSALTEATMHAATLWDDPDRLALASGQVATMGIDAMAARLAVVYRDAAAIEEATG
jgi:glycosyltransferase involved in cell wall biosynthesis